MNQIVSSHLKEDQRIHEDVLASKKIYDDDHYAVQIHVFPGIKSSLSQQKPLITFEATYKAENLKILAKLMATNVVSDDWDQVFRDIVDHLEEKKLSPLHLIRDAKAWCNVEFTHDDRRFLADGGVDL